MAADRNKQGPLPGGMPAHTDAVREPRLRRPPFAAIAVGLVLVVASWIPLVGSARARVERSREPRVSLVQDMGSQPKYREQQSSLVFADGRADRPPVLGTVARGKLNEDDAYYRGFTLDPATNGVKYVDGFPAQVQLTDATLARGQQRFNIYCAPCHGGDGMGRGPVAIRAEEVGYPINPANLHDAATRARPNGHIYNTINSGIKKMPAYGPQVPVEDRWAIVAYVRALQFSQSAPARIVPAERLSAMAVPAMPTTSPATAPQPGATR